MEIVLNYILKAINLYSILILVSILLSWADRNGQMQITKFVKKLTDPYLNLFKIIVPLGGMYFDVSPIIGILLLRLLENIILNISDNGIGFNSNTVNLGNGIFNMKKRVKDMHGAIEFVSNEFNGTTVLIKLPYKRFMI